ncbi:hypothetical protein FACS1894170_02160 [Planctomycetales bacterium]|nr:hypothetical protein FACS1894170_02160 [Planctomycetales bacterium]
MATFYPTYADYETVAQKNPKPFEKQPTALAPLDADGNPDIKQLNDGLSEDYLRDKTNPRWVVKETIAYLWARTVQCKNCRSTVPLLKTRWLCKKEKKRVLLEMETCTDGSGAKTVQFSVNSNVPPRGGNAAQNREHDKRISAGTMTRNGAKCPCCGAMMSMEDIRLEGKNNRLGNVMTAVAVSGQNGKEYRRPFPHEIEMAQKAEAELERVFAEIPFGLPDEPTPKVGSGASRAFSIDGYGIDKWHKLFTPRQLLALGTFVKWTRKVGEVSSSENYPPIWQEAVKAYLACGIDRLLDRNSMVCWWQTTYEQITSTFFSICLTYYLGSWRSKSNFRMWREFCTSDRMGCQVS